MSYAGLVVGGELGLSKYLRQINALPMLSQEEEYALASQWKNHSNIRAAQKLVMSHVRLVVKIAQKFKGYGLPMMDLISEGNVGLMKAVKKFDPDLGYRLATYAIWWIKATIQDYILRSWSMVKIGTSAMQKKLFFNLKKIKKMILSADEDFSGDLNLVAAEKLGVSKERVDDMSAGIVDVLSLQDMVGDSDDDRSELLDHISSDENFEEIICNSHDQKLMSNKLHAAIAQLSEREREIIKARKLSELPETLENLSMIYGVSRERIRQIEEGAINHLREIMSKAVQAHV